MPLHLLPSDIWGKLTGSSDRLVVIAYINPDDSGRAQRILNNNHIPAAIGGSVKFDIDVSIWDRAKAVDILKKEFVAKGYRIVFRKSN